MEKLCEPQQEVSPSLDTDQGAAFVRLGQRVPPHYAPITLISKKSGGQLLILMRWEIYCVGSNTVFHSTARI